MNEKNLITPQGLQQLKNERDALIHSAAAEGSNTDATARIFYLTQRIDAVEVVDSSIHQGDPKIYFGATVVLEDLDTDTHVIYQIVGEDEVDPAEGKVSLLSPIGKILLGKKEGENLVLDERAYTIFNVRYESAESPEIAELTESPEIAESSESPEIAESTESSESEESTENPESAESPEIAESEESTESPESSESEESPENAALYEKLSKLRTQMAESLSRGGASFTEQHLAALDTRLRLLESQKMRKSTVND